MGSRLRSPIPGAAADSYTERPGGRELGAELGLEPLAHDPCAKALGVLQGFAVGVLASLDAAGSLLQQQCYSYMYSESYWGAQPQPDSAAEALPNLENATQVPNQSLRSGENE